MICSLCHHTNARSNRYCSQCGTLLARACGACEFENPPTHRFCGGCGSRLPDENAEPDDVGRDPEAEHRQLTLMFCDIVDSTELSGIFDAEEIYQVIKAYQESCSEAVARVDGHVAQHLGDGVLVYFGHPRAHEDDPVRAIQTALAILSELPHLNARIAERIPLMREHPLRLRIGVHTGQVVVGELGSGDRQERLALGGPPNLAARLEKIAEPDTVVISASTRRLVEGIFVLEDLGPKTLRGVSEPVAAYRVLDRAGVGGSLAPPGLAGLTPLVGRDQELALLLDRWEQVSEGRGQAVLLSGEPGMGKSRLVAELRERLSDEPHTWLEARCSLYHQTSVFHPVIDTLKRELTPEADGTTESIVAELERSLADTGLPLRDTVPPLAELLSLPLPASYEREPTNPETFRRRTLETLAAWLFSLSERQPVILAVEDLHWIDPSTLELLGMMVDQIPTARVLMLLTFRPEFQAPWTGRSHSGELPLHALTRRQMGAMIDALVGDKKLPAEVFAEVLARADGVPLFVEELTKNLLESDLLVDTGTQYELHGALPELAIPTTLQDSLMARLDRLGATKELAQLASVLGRDFSHDLLAAVSPLDDSALARGLDELLAAELLYQRGVRPRAVYTFKHALILETANGSLLRTRRREFHERIASTLVERFPERVDSQPEVVAYHFAEAGRHDDAINYYQRAGEHASQRSAHREGIDHLSRGIEVLRRLSESPERNQRELELQVKLGAPMILTRGQGAPEVQDVYARARELCSEIGDTPELFPTLWGLARYYGVHGQLDAALEIDEQLLLIAEQAQDATRLMWAHLSLGLGRFWKGEPTVALEHLEQTLALHEDREQDAIAELYGQDPAVSAASISAVTLWLLGRPDSALERSREAVERGRSSGHPLSEAFALNFAAVLHHFRRERELVVERAEQALAIAEDQGFPMWQGFAHMMRGWARSSTDASGLDELRNGLDQLSTVGVFLGRSYWLSLLAEALETAGREDDAARALDEALDVARQQSSPNWNAEVHRLQGELLLGRGDDGAPEAERRFLDALKVAKEQRALGLELRAAVSLARLLAGRGRDAEARALLSEVYGRFDQGYESSDLREAKALVDQLS